MSFLSIESFKYFFSNILLVIISLSLSIILLFNLIAFPFINRLISLLEFSNSDKIISSIILILSRFSLEIFTVGKFDPADPTEKASFAAFSDCMQLFLHVALL